MHLEMAGAASSVALRAIGGTMGSVSSSSSGAGLARGGSALRTEVMEPGAPLHGHTPPPASRHAFTTASQTERSSSCGARRTEIGVILGVRLNDRLTNKERYCRNCCKGATSPRSKHSCGKDEGTGLAICSGWATGA